MVSEEEMKRELNERFEKLKNPEIGVTVVGSDLVHDKLVAQGWKPTVKIPRLEEALKRPGGGGSSSPELAIEMAKRRFSPDRYEFKVVKHYALHGSFPYIVFVREKTGGNPELTLQNCIDVRVTPEENIEIRFKDIPTCEPVKDEYEKVLRTALMGGETIYKTLPTSSSEKVFSFFKFHNPEDFERAKRLLDGWGISHKVYPEYRIRVSYVRRFDVVRALTSAGILFEGPE